MIDDVINEVKTVLAANLNAEIGTLNDIDEFYIAELDTPPTRFPVVFILADHTMETNWIGGQMHDETHTVAVTLLHQHVNNQTLARDLFKYKAALRRTIVERLPQSPAQYINAVKVLRHDYSPMIRVENGAYSKSVELTVEMRERIAEL